MASYQETTDYFFVEMFCFFEIVEVDVFVRFMTERGVSRAENYNWTVQFSKERAVGGEADGGGFVDFGDFAK